MSKSLKSERLGIRVSQALKAALTKLAEADKRSLSAYIEIVLEQHVKATERKHSETPKQT